MSEYEIALRRIHPQTVVSIRDTIDSFGDQGALWNALATGVAQHRVAAVCPSLTIYPDAEYRENDVDVEVDTPISARPSGDEARLTIGRRSAADHQRWSAADHQRWSAADHQRWSAADRTHPARCRGDGLRLPPGPLRQHRSGLWRAHSLDRWLWLYGFVGPSREVHLHCPDHDYVDPEGTGYAEYTTNDPAVFVSDVQLPVAKA